MANFTVGDKVEKIGGDYTFAGTVVSVFPKLSGAIRLVVEDDRGVLHVYSEKNLRALHTSCPGCDKVEDNYDYIISHDTI
jgi:hypothetical protein